MEDVRVCRICLSTDVMLHDLSTYPLKLCYEVLMGNNIHNVHQLPLVGCYICVSLLVKFYKFRARCLEGQATLNSLVHSCGQITENGIQQIKEQKNIISSSLAAVELLTLDIPPLGSEDDNKNDIKIEPVEDENEDYFNDCDNIKQETNYNDLFTSDDEPLSIHKSNKQQKFEKKKEKAKKVKKKKVEKNLCDLGEEPMQCDTNDTQSLDHEDYHDQPVDASAFIQSLPFAVEKRKRGRPRKSVQDRMEHNLTTKPVKLRRARNNKGNFGEDIDLETCCRIIKLSTEAQKEEIDKRQHSSNYLNAMYQCEVCYKGFIDTHAWNHHNRKHDPSAGEFECPICRIRFKTKRTLQKHAANHEMKYECKSCSYVSKTTTQAKQHQRWHKGVTYKCQYCDEISTQWTSHLSHVRIKHPSEFICNVCGYSFVSKLGLTMHKTMMHKDVDETFETEDQKDSYCEECDVTFVSEEAWKRHMVTSAKHTETKDFKNGCRVCGEKFADAEQLRLHHRRNHARSRPKNYGKRRVAPQWPAPCTHCTEEIMNARDYWAHFRRAHPDKNYPIQKNYVCDICGKSFRGNAFLVYHKRTHSEEKTFKCGACPKAFFNRYNLQMHERTHSDHRPHACSVCFKAFKCKGALDRHFRSHTGEKPYSCEVCGKAFAQSNSRKLHVRTVHLKQPSPYVSRARLERRARAPAPPAPHALLY